MNSENTIVIIGSGLSGLMTAYKLAESGVPSLVISKGPLIQTNTWMAQGGIAAVTSRSDSLENHMRDTLKAGDGLCHGPNVEQIISLGPELIAELISSGMLFDTEKGKLSLAKEGGHNQRRILHVDDQTGKAMHEFILNTLLTTYKNLCSFLPNHMVTNVENLEDSTFNIELLKIEDGNLYDLKCSHLILATGGVGKAFTYTSNWEGATGDGLKIAHDLGAGIINMEMVQFHPTCLFHPEARNFLISEAVRGEGAHLINHAKKRFTYDFHPDGELAPRDIVSQAIEHEIKSSGKDSVFLDARHLNKNLLLDRFPNIYKKCLDLGIDITVQPIPVVPAAHYFCGGISTDKTLVKTPVENLYAVGESGYTGLHGANRLASNSLLECLVTAHLCKKELLRASKEFYQIKPTPSLSKKTPPLKPNFDDLFIINALWDETRSLMWNYVGIQRSKKRLLQAHKKVAELQNELTQISPEVLNKDLVELKNILFFSEGCITSGLTREESRGCHAILDYPKKDKVLYNTNYLNKVSKKEFFQKDL